MMIERSRLLYIYASQDESLMLALESHLTALSEEGFFEGRHIGQLLAGTDVSLQLAAEVDQAGVVLLLLSADFMASASCRSLLGRVQEQRATRRLLVVPVLARPVDWRVAGLGDLQPLPRNGHPVTRWENQDAAWVDVAEGLRAVLTTSSTRAGSAKAIIDFAGERIRHESFCGREDVLAQLDQWLLGGRHRGYVLITGGPGMGKSALLNEWLRRQEQAGEQVPHHFLRRGQQDWDQPVAVTRNLAAQIEQLFPAQRDIESSPERRMGDLLLRVSKDILAPQKRRLILVVDGLDEAAAAPGDNPLPLFLPWALPPFVRVLCASRPTYPNLGWLKARDGGVQTIDLDDTKWLRSSEEACRKFWQGQDFAPSLTDSLIEQALDRGRGNLLYAVKLRDQLESLSVDERRAIELPEGLEGWLDESWQRFVADETYWSLIEKSLGLLCAAREALPVSVLDALLGGVSCREALLRRVRSVLLEESASRQPQRDGGEITYRIYHESFRSFIEKKLGGVPAMQVFHQRLVDALAPWPAAEESFRRRYVLQHGIAQRVEAGRWQQVRALCLDAGYLQAKVAMVGLEATESDVEQAARQCREPGLRKELNEVARALRAESHWLQKVPHELAGLVYNRLVNAGWPEGRLKPIFGTTVPIRLQHPLQRRDMSERTLIGHSVEVMACGVSADGRRAVSGSDDKTLRVWDLDSGRERFTLAGHLDRVNACAVSADGKRAVSGSDDKTLKVWDLDSGRELFTLSGHLDRVSACGLSADGKRAVSGSDDKTLKVWDLDNGRELFTLWGHLGGVNTCGVSADGKRAVSGSWDQTIRVWDLDGGRELFIFSGHSDSVNACGVSADGKRAISGSWDQTLKVWDLDSGRELFTLSGHSDWVRACGISADGKRAISGSEDQTLKVWDLDRGRELFTLSGHSRRVRACAVSADGKRAISGSDDKTVKVWGLDSDPESFTLSGHADRVRACGISADGRRAISGSWDRTVRVWDLDHGRELFTLSGHLDRVRACGVSADGKRAISGSEDKTLKVWDLDRGLELFTLSGHLDRVNACGMSADGKRAISGSSDRTLKVWDLDNGRELFTLCGHIDWVRACGMSADGRRAISGASDRALKVWDLYHGRELWTISGCHSDSVNACAMSADGKLAVSGSKDMMLKLWDLDRGRELWTFSGHSDSVNACAMSADGKLAVSGSEDKTMKVWDLDSGTCLGTVYGSGAFCTVALRGSRIVAGDTAGNVWMIGLSDTLWT